MPILFHANVSHITYDVSLVLVRCPLNILPLFLSYDFMKLLPIIANNPFK